MRGFGGANWAQRLRKEVWQHLSVVLATIPTSLFVAHYIGYPSKIRGASMFPTLHGPDSMGADVVWSTPVRNEGLLRLNRGDVVVLNSSHKPGKVLIKRLLGLPGDCIACNRGRGHAIVVPPGHAWVEGDNTPCSNDSTHFGAIPLGLIISKASLIVWPPQRVGSLASHIPKVGRPRQSLVGRVLRTDDDWKWAASFTDD